MRNPFRVLGLDISELKGLKIEQLKMIINSQYRALQKIHHPDIGGSEKKSRLLNWAKEELLSDDKKLSDWIEASSRKNMITGLQEKVVSYARLITFYRGVIFNLYSKVCKIGITSNYVDLLGLGESGLKVCRSLTMNQQDSLLAGLGSEIEDKEQRRLFRQAERQKIIDRTFFDLRVEDGSLIEIDCDGNEKNISDRLLIGVITSETIRKKFNGSQESIRKFLAKVCPTPKEDLVGLTYQGGVSKDRVLDQFNKKQLIRLLPFLSFKLSNECWLFSLSIDPSGNVIARLEGQVFNRVHQAKIIKKT